MKPFEQISRYSYVNLWHLLPFAYVFMNRFGASELDVALLPLLIVQCSITCGLLLLGFKIFEQRKVRKLWIWIQTFVVIAILWIYISDLIVFSKWLSIILHIGFPITCFIVLYKLVVIGYEVPPMRNRTLENTSSK